MSPFFLYLLIINIVSILVFAIDKVQAKNQKQRIPEKILHLLEALGGVFGIILTMYVIHHKSSKWQYYIITFIILIAWILGFQYFNISIF
ncbi:MAG: DUF1294 domain-containing protein [Bacteroidales bacterium]|jgi:uncharacterized membrane protein YsdA (DUF1294 family)|nr:DUF1294 domain-containing protein [Bacteroidales bacterium]MDY4789196.1 DUF1294 domain-containing protein [Bacteroidales bacterium]NCC18330.1 DUF1294 domain-containing protein [Bacteroidia bacterium]